MKFIHAADLHLDSPLKNLERYDGAPADAIRGATRRALENLVTLARDEAVDFVLLAGDIYDGDWKDYNTGLFFLKQMAALAEAKIPVVMISGNHDAANKMTRALKLPAGVRLLDTKRPETLRLDDLQVAIHGLSFESASVADNVVREYPSAVAGWFNIGLLHTSLDMESGEHARYAPCKIDDLIAREYDYWALGHIHQRKCVQEEPHVAYPGNIQGRHIRECGTKGCLVVETDGSAGVAARFVPLDVMRWEICTVDVSGAADIEQVLARFEDEARKLVERHGEMPLAMRVSITGRCAAHGEMRRMPTSFLEQVRGAGIALADGSIWVEKVVCSTMSLHAAPAPADDGPLGELSALTASVRHDEQSLAALAAVIDDLVRKLPTELREGPEAIPAGQPQWLAQLVDEAEPLLVGRLRSLEKTS